MTDLRLHTVLRDSAIPAAIGLSVESRIKTFGSMLPLNKAYRKIGIKHQNLVLLVTIVIHCISTLNS